MRRKRLTAAYAAALLALVPAATRLGAQEAPALAPARGDTASLALGDAVGRALSQSEEVRLAQSAVSLAESQVTGARSAALPQVSANLGYTRTFASSFGGGGTRGYGKC